MSIQIAYLKLVNFIGIKAGMNRNEIEIDFSKSKNRIILLLGENGSGKSTILSTAHPFRETFDERDSYILPGEEGLKEVHFYKGNDFYRIVHTYGEKNQSFIFKNKNKVALNGSGGIRTFIAEVEKEFGLTPDHLKLLKIGSKTGNCIELTSTERKTLLGKFTPSIEEYLNYFKIVNDKFNAFAKEIRFINDEISKLGDEKLLNDQTILTKKRLEEVENEINRLTKKSISLEVNYEKCLEQNSFVFELKEELLAFEKEITPIEKSINTIIEQYPALEGKNYRKVFERLSNEINEIQKEINSFENEISLSTNSIIFLNRSISRLEDDVKRLNSNRKRKESKEDLEVLLNETKTKIDERNESIRLLVENGYDASKLTESMEGELETIVINSQKMFDTIQEMKNNFSFITSDLDQEDVIAYMSNESSELIESSLKETEEFILQNEEKIKAIKIKTEKLLKRVALNNVTDLCTTKGCKVFEQSKANEADKNEVARLDEEKSTLENENNEAREFFKLLEYAKKLQSFLNNEVRMALELEFSAVINANSHLNQLASSKDLGVTIFKTPNNDLSKAFDNSPLIKGKRLLLAKNKFETDLLVYNNEITLADENKDIVANLEKEILSEKNKITALVKSKNENQTLLDTTLKQLENKNKNLSIVQKICSLKENYDELNKNYLPKKEKYESVKENVDKVIMLEKELKDVKKELNEFKEKKNELIPIFDNNRLAIERIRSYEERKSSLMNERDVLKTVKECLDIKTGIPLHILGKFVEDVKEETNNLLSIALKENFEIDFEIDEKEFKIPVKKNGIQYAKDITSCSQGEMSIVKCAFSLGILNRTFKNSHSIYNIVQLDELDSEFDKHNSFSFLEVLNYQLDELNAKQCFVITHNNAFDRTQVSVILLKGCEIDVDNPDEMINKQVVADFR